MRKKDKNIPEPNSTIIYVLEKEGHKPVYGVGTVYKAEYYPIICSGMIKQSIETGLKWCYVDELEIIEKQEE
ncbi:MAG: hypothetical protein NC085_01145 [Muribaculaceae bacterium]|nr:hypothetical protein [Muribaculaceae bacterium]